MDWLQCWHARVELADVFHLRDGGHHCLCCGPLGKESVGVGLAIRPSRPPLHGGGSTQVLAVMIFVVETESRFVAGLDSGV